MNIYEMDHTYVANTYGRFPVELTRGEGSVVYDEKGKRYIDFGSGIAVNAFGIGDPVWKAAVVEQLDKIPHASNLYYTEPCAKLARLLCERTGMRRVFFGNSGAEANECAIKAARKWSSDTYGEGARPVIITLVNSFHGRTITTLSATGQDVFHHSFGPFTPGFVHVPANDLDAMTRAFSENKVAAVMVEMVQGEGGVLPLTKEFAVGTEALARENGALVIVDEVQTGNGRTGALYAYELYGLKPDIVSTAKGIGGGLPIGACLLGERVENTMTPGSHGSTFGGNPIAAAGAFSILSRIDDVTLADVQRKHDLIVRALDGAKGVVGVTGLGLMLGVETVRGAKEIANACLENGLLVLTAKTKVRLLPALNIPDEVLHEGLDILLRVVGA